MNIVSRKFVVILMVWVPGFLFVPGCSIGYSFQAVSGQMKIVTSREPVDKLLATPDLDPGLRARLVLSQRVLEFAQAEILLPGNGSYRSYVDTGRPYVVWNVFAAPEFSLSPEAWCFPVAGCVAYRGYFKQQTAEKFAGKLKADGKDVHVAGIPAYSTLGWFRDPLLNTMLPMSDIAFAGLLFHELTHQVLYVKDHTAFNEAFATTVELEALRRWVDAEGVFMPNRAAGVERRDQVRELLRQLRRQLKKLYASDLSESAKRERKAAVFRDVHAEYETRADIWQANSTIPVRKPYGALMAQGLNNASLAAIAAYDNYVPAFQRLLVAACGYDLACFYAAVENMTRLTKADRKARLSELLADAELFSATKKSRW
jgi:predicted aminopeptidase